MAWDGSLIYQVYEDYFILEYTGFDADAEQSSGITITEFSPFIPSSYTMCVKRTGGATDVIAAILLGFDPSGANSKTLLSTTAHNGIVSTTTDYTGTDIISEHNLTKLNVKTTTVGAGNTLTIYIIGKR